MNLRSVYVECISIDIDNHSGEFSLKELSVQQSLHWETGCLFPPNLKIGLLNTVALKYMCCHSSGCI